MDIKRTNPQGLKTLVGAIDGDTTTPLKNVEYKALKDNGVEDNPAISPIMGMTQEEVDKFCLSCACILREPAFYGMLDFYSNFLANRAMKYANTNSISRIQGMGVLIEMLKDELNFYANVHNSKVVRESETSEEIIN